MQTAATTRAAFTATETFRVETFPLGYENCRVTADESVSGLTARIHAQVYSRRGLMVEVFSNVDGRRIFGLA